MTKDKANEERVWRDYLKSLGHEFFGWHAPSANDLIPSKDLIEIQSLDKPIEYRKD